MKHLWLFLAGVLTLFFPWRLYVAFEAQRLYAAGQRDDAFMALAGNDPLWRVALQFGGLSLPFSFGVLNLTSCVVWLGVAALSWFVYQQRRRPPLGRRHL